LEDLRENNFVQALLGNVIYSDDAYNDIVEQDNLEWGDLNVLWKGRYRRNKF
jgi:hypothetical protein